jgi:hypothetical protein
MQLRRFILASTLAALLTLLVTSSAYAQNLERFRESGSTICQAHDSFCLTPGAFYTPGLSPGTTIESLHRMQASQWTQNQDFAYMPRPTRSDEDEPAPHATPDAADQSELLKNARDPEFILRNFKTMYVKTIDTKFFKVGQMRAALGSNSEFRKLGITMVDDPRVADVVLVVRYTFAWDYPFELRHQNTTEVLLAGKGEGPFSGPLGAADVARVFVNMAKPWRTLKK